VPVYGSLCKGRGNPRLFLDMWRIAFQQFIKHGQAVHDRRMTGGDVSLSIDNIIRKLPGLKAPQFQQRSLNTRTAWDIYKNLPKRRPSMFFNVLPAPRLLPDHDGNDKQKFEASQLEKTSLYTQGGYNPNIQALLVNGHGLWRRDNNENPHELMEEAGFILVSVSKNLNGYFNTRERKSKGLTEQLDRRLLIILDHEYTGKETSYLLDQSTPEDDDTQVEDMATIPILRRGFNPVIMRELDLDDVAAKCGITRETLLTILRGERKTANGVMKYIRSAFTYDEETGHIEFEPQQLSADKQLLRRLQFLVGKVYAKVQKECNDHNSKLARDLASGKISEDDADKTMSWMDTFATRMAISEDEAYKLLRGQHIEHMIKKQKRQARRLLADLERVYGVTEVREANAQKVALLHSPEQRAREFERRKAHRQSIRDNNLSQIVGTFEREVADLFTFKCGDEPFKGFVSRMISLATFFLALWFFSNKDVQAAARKVMTIPERKADGVLVQFEKSLFDRLTNGVERRREQGRKRIARHRAADKANEPIHTIVDSPLVE
jgi:transcriptional regulator with XRE-family HTH domain